MRNRIAIMGIAAVLVISIIATIVVFRRNDPVSKYWAFMGRDQNYFTQVAAACEQLAPYRPAGLMQTVKIDVNDERVPAVIKALRPGFIELHEDRVYVGFGGGRSQWGIYWVANDFDAQTWELRVNADGKDTFLLKTNVVRVVPMVTTNLFRKI